MSQKPEDLTPRFDFGLRGGNPQPLVDFDGGFGEEVDDTAVLPTFPTNAASARPQFGRRPPTREPRQATEYDRRGLLQALGLGILATVTIVEEVKVGLGRKALGAAAGFIFRRGSSGDSSTAHHEEDPVAVNLSVNTLLAKGPTETQALIEQNRGAMSTEDVIDLIDKLPWGTTRKVLYNEYAKRVADGTAGDTKNPDQSKNIVQPSEEDKKYWQETINTEMPDATEAMKADALNAVIFALNHCRSLFGDADVQSASSKNGNVYQFGKKSAQQIIDTAIKLGLRQSALGLAMGTKPVAEILPILDQDQRSLVIKAIEQANAAEGNIGLTPQTVWGTPTKTVSNEAEIRFGIGAANVIETNNFIAVHPGLNLFSPQDWLKGMVLNQI